MGDKGRKKSYVINDKYLVKDDKFYLVSENQEHVYLGNSIWVEKIVQNIDTQNVDVMVAFPFNDTIQRKSLKRSDITESGLKKLTKYGADTWAEVVEHYLTVMRLEISRIPVEFEHSQHGWGMFQDKPIFRHYKAIGIDSSYDNGQFDLKPLGSYEEWLSVIEKEVLGKKWTEFALVLGFVGCLLAKLSLQYKIIDSLLVCFVGVTSKGKTACTRVALSPWGFPDKTGKGLMPTWFGTNQGVMDNFKGVFGIPLGIDDTSLIGEEMDITDFVYQFTNGVSKQALNSDGTRRAQGEWKTVGITSSEESMLAKMQKKGGIRVRYMEVEDEMFTESAENAEEIEKGFLANYGHAGPMFAEYLYHKDTDELYEMVEETKAYLVAHMDQDPLTKRKSSKLALILYTAQLIREALGITIDMEMLTETLIKMEQDSVQERDIAEQAMDYLRGHYYNNSGLYFRDGHKPSNKSIGKYVIENNKIVELRYVKGNFEKLLQWGKFNNAKQVINSFKEKGWLVHDKSKQTLARVYSPGTPRTPQYAIKFVGSQDNENDSTKELEIATQSICFEVIEDGEWVEYKGDVSNFPFDRDEDLVQRGLGVTLQELEELDYKIIEDEGEDEEVLDETGEEDTDANEDDDSEVA